MAASRDGAVSRALALIVPAGAVLWSGTAHPPATLALAAASALLLLLSSREPLRLTPLALLPLALALLCALQLLPLRGGRPITLDPSATLDELAKLLGVGCLAIALTALGESDRGRLRASLALAAAALIAPALLGALGVPLPRLLMPIPVGRAPLRFPLGNPNHAASLLLLVLPLALVELTRRRGTQRLVAGAVWLLANAILVATGSRAAFVLSVVEQVVVAGLWVGRSGIRRQRWLMVGAGVAAALALTGGALVERLIPGTGAGRLSLWINALELVRAHPLLGVGRGAFEPAFARYDLAAGSLRHGFVENQYLQVVADGGLVGALLAAVAVWLALRWMRRPEKETAAAALVGLAALALHNAVDFSVESGAVAAAACAAGALALPGSGPLLGGVRARLLAASALVAVGLAGARMAGARTDEDLTALASAPAERVESLAGEAMRRHPADGHLAATAALRLSPQPGAVPWVERALTLAPRDVLAHRAAARCLAQAGQLRQAAGELRRAIELSGDTNPDALLDEAAALLGGAPDELARAVPARWQVTLAERLQATRRWALVDAVARAGLAEAPDDPRLLRLVLTAALAQSSAATPQWAERLAAVSSSPADALMVAKALAATHSDQAQRALEEALARAVDTGDKAALHSALGDLAAQRGDLNRAALERDRALQLSRH